MTSTPPVMRRRWAPTTTILAMVATAVTLSAAPSGETALADLTSRLAGRAPEIVARTIDGRTFRLSALRGKVVVLDFLTPDCGDCQLEAPLLERAAQRYAASGVRVVIVDLSNAAAGLLRRVYRGQFALAKVAVVRDHGGRIARSYNVFDLGTTYVIGRDGRVAWHGLWRASYGALTGAISRSL